MHGSRDECVSQRSMFINLSFRWSTYSSHGALGIPYRNAHIPSLCGTTVIATVRTLALIYWFVGEVNLASWITLSGGNVGASCWAEYLTRCEA